MSRSTKHEEIYDRCFSEAHRTFDIFRLVVLESIADSDSVAEAVWAISAASVRLVVAVADMISGMIHELEGDEGDYDKLFRAYLEDLLAYFFDTFKDAPHIKGVDFDRLKKAVLKALREAH